MKFSQLKFDLSGISQTVKDEIVIGIADNCLDFDKIFAAASPNDVEEVNRQFTEFLEKMSDSGAQGHLMRVTIEKAFGMIFKLFR